MSTQTQANIFPLESVRAEDFVEYFLFPGVRSPDNNSLEQDLGQVAEQINQIAVEYSSNYIWHKDGFRVAPRFANAHLLVEQTLDNSDDDLVPSHVYGITYFDDNIQDEWFVVSLLFELTRKIEGLVVRVVDADGEFMLIEAAEHLPQWANPETCSQRLYILNGKLHLVSPATNDTTPPPATSVEAALSELRRNPSVHLMTSAVQQCIAERIRHYPAGITANLHRQTVFVPIAAAALLAERPQLVAAVVRAFVHRDPIDMKACRAMKYFPPENRVRTSVVFTKYLYAMLSHSQYTPDRRTGWNLPPNPHEQFKAHSLGVKLACGFEILAAQARPQDDLETNKAWLKYVEGLSSRGYFQGLLEGSQEHQRLLETAKEYFRNQVESVPYNSEVGQDIVALLRSLEFSVDEFKEKEATLPEDDDESWLNVSPEDLDAMLASRYGIKKSVSANGNVDAVELTGELTDFLDRKSEWDGVEVKDDGPVAPKRNGKKSAKVQFDEPMDISANTSGNIDFNPDDFFRNVQRMVDLVIPEDDWESNSDMSDFEEEDLGRNMDNMTNGKSLEGYMQQMDEELSKTTIGKSFETKRKEDNFDDIESFQPVDIDVNTLKNMAHSYQSQFGGPGPASSLLGSMGIKVKNDKQDIRDTPV